MSFPRSKSLQTFNLLSSQFSALSPTGFLQSAKSTQATPGQQTFVTPIPLGPGTPKAIFFSLGVGKSAYDDKSTPVVDPLFPYPQLTPLQSFGTNAAQQAIEGLPELANWRRYLILLGSSITLLVAALQYCFGNMSPYLATYVAYYNNDISYRDALAYCNYVFSVSMVAQPIGCVAGGYVDVYFGPKVSLIGGGLTFIAGTFALAFTLSSVLGQIIFFGCFVGFGSGMCLSLGTMVSLTWFPGYEGIVTGVIMFASGSGPFVFNNIETLFANPNNAPLDPDVGYSNSPDVVNRIPQMFLLIAVFCTVFISLGVFLILAMPGSTSVIDIEPNEIHCTQKDAIKMTAEVDSINIKQDMSPMDAMKTLPFWNLIAIQLFFSAVFIFNMQAYKIVIAEITHIQDDHFLSLVGSVASIVSAISRLLSGLFFDWTGKSFGITMGLINFVGVIFCFLLEYIPQIAAYNMGAEKALAMICVSGLFACNGFYVVLPYVLGTTFGNTHRSALLGCIYLAEVPTTFLVSFLLNTLPLKIVIDIMGFSCVACIVLSLLFDKHIWPLVCCGRQRKRFRKIMISQRPFGVENESVGGTDALTTSKVTQYGTIHTPLQILETG